MKDVGKVLVYTVKKN